ncbi:MAG: protease pro-enzyme activation domain-containing protein [Terracidiphilus sp.]
MLALSRQNRLRICGWIAACAMAATAVGAQTPVPRIQSEISSSYMSTLKGSLHPLAQPQFDAGRMPSDTRLNGMTIVFNRTAAQQASLDALIAAQQNPASPLYHQWLTPDQFAARFGMSQPDIDKVETWLQQQGFSIDSVARSRNMIHFSGTVGQAEMAFQTQMHYYNVEGAKHFAPATDLSVPTALAPVVLGVRNLNDFRLKPMHITAKSAHLRPSFTSGQTGKVFFAPGDIRVAYDMNPLLNSSVNGTGQVIAVMGQSAVVNSDIEAFQSAADLPTKDPTMVLVPGSGSSMTYAGDETESDLDLEWSGAMAPGATIDFVYTGNGQNSGVWDSLLFAVDQKIGNIITLSYGGCEPLEGGTTGVAPIESALQQAESQGQTVIASSGDSGSTACFIENPPQTGDPTLAVQEELAVNYPASSPYVTGLGGTEITAADSVSKNSTYWDAETPGSDILTSAKIYIPEVAWNDDTPNCGQADCLSASGGGLSILFPKPSWQTALTPADSYRDVPDIALYSSPGLPGYLYCTSDQSAWVSGQTASCNSGFRDGTTGDLTVAGGTSFAAPIFAGMLAIINQKAGFTTGQGLINPKLYSMAASGGTYTAAAGFHDITTGNNECTAGSTFCSSTSGSTVKYSAGTGYDLVTGLGSVDLDKLATSWAGNSGTGAGLISTTTTVSTSNTSPALNANDTFTITVAAVSGTVAPTGTAEVAVDGGTATSVTLQSDGTVADTISFSTTGPHTVVAQYVGNTTFAASTGVITISVPGSTSGTGTFTLAASPSTLTVSQGSSGTETLTVTPKNGYTGTVDFTYDTSNNTALANLCIFGGTGTNSDGSITVSGTTPVAAQITIDTNASDCVSAAVVLGAHNMHRILPRKIAKNSAPSGPNPAPLGVAFAGLLLAGFLGRRSRKFRTMAGLIALLAVGLAVSACGGGSSGGGGTAPTDPTKGTYTITFTGQDSASATATANAGFTLTID